VEGLKKPLFVDLTMGERGSYSRHLFLLAAVVLAFLAVVRLGVLLSRSMSEKSAPSAGPRVVAKEISLEIKGAGGEVVRLHFPEVPLNIDHPYQAGRLTVPLKLKMTKRPQKVICQLLKGGRVVAQSDAQTLPEGEKVDLGTVKVKAR
jgi:hypothetical protein